MDRIANRVSVIGFIVLVVIYFLNDSAESPQVALWASARNIGPELIPDILATWFLFAGSYFLLRSFQRLRDGHRTEELVKRISVQVEALLNAKIDRLRSDGVIPGLPVEVAEAQGRLPVSSERFATMTESILRRQDGRIDSPSHTPT